MSFNKYLVPKQIEDELIVGGWAMSHFVSRVILGAPHLDFEMWGTQV